MICSQIVFQYIEFISAPPVSIGKTDFRSNQLKKQVLFMYIIATLDKVLQ